MIRLALIRDGIAVAIAMAMARPAAADPCRDGLLDPPAISMRDSGFDQARSACLGRSVRSQARALALIDTPAFYGTLSASLFAALRHDRGPWEWEAGARMLDYRFAQNAVITADEISLGPLWLALTRALRGGDTRVAASVRATVPRTDSGYDLTTVGLSSGLYVTGPLGRWALYHARASLLLWAASSASGAQGRAAAALSWDAAWAATGWLALVAGAEAQGGWHGAGLDHVAMRAALRFAIGARYRLGISAATVIAGRERIDLVAQLGLVRAL